jgi:hypothetical protein
MEANEITMDFHGRPVVYQFGELDVVMLIFIKVARTTTAR